MTGRSEGDRRTLIHAPVGRDALLTERLLVRAELPCRICGTLEEVCAEFEAGAGAIMLTEEAVERPEISRLATALAEQPAWSDVPVLLFAGGEESAGAQRTLRALDVLRNVTLLDRPMRISAVISTLRAALRARERQYELRDVLLALRAARDDAERADRLKDEFLATLSHELRTPLNAILGWIAILQSGQLPEDRFPHILEVIRRNAELQAQIVADALDMSRIVTGRLLLNITRVRLAAVIGDSVETIKAAADAKGIRIAVTIDRALPDVDGDAARLQQVFWNLLSNAVKFTPAAGEILVTATRQADGVAVCVSDTGIGLAKEFLPFAFDRFRQGDQSFARAHGGLGLGLAIVKHLVELHGGRVTVESGGEGHGSTFAVHLPSRAAKGRRTAAREPRSLRALRESPA